MIKIKEGVEFTLIAPAGCRILEALKKVAKGIAYSVTITSACDGEHSGPDDPHHKGEAYDIRTNGLTSQQKNELLSLLMVELGPRFYAFIEAPATPNEHIHVQRAKGTTYSIEDYLANL